MRQLACSCVMTFVCLVAFLPSRGQPPAPRFRALAVYENGGHHIAYSKVARPWLDQLAADSQFVIDYVHNMDSVNESFLARYQLIIQLDYPPYAWPAAAVTAFERYIKEARGGWVGFHHAGLLGEFDGYKMWDWFSQFMGGIRFTNYIGDFAAGEVQVEDSLHPIMRGLPRRFTIQREEWYTWNKSPRSQVQVLASVDERTYQPRSHITMGDHPVVWTNPHVKARNVYIFMGHGPDLLDNPAYTRLVSNAINWAARK